ncbi:MAG: tRNA epoxyqueuosine(34) reductase QueG [Anaeromyxobacteraceae bacterium]
MPSPLDSAFVKGSAIEAGFHEVGVARAEPLDPAPLDRILAAGAEADMDWLAAQRAQRLDPAKVLPGARSVIVVALSHAVPEGTSPAAGFGEVARYARGRDYHTVMKRRLAALSTRLRERDPAASLFASCDVAPVMEKAWAQRAGLGWVGKNGCFITTRHGSWVVLGTILVDRELQPDSPSLERCGGCALCIPACPTGAIPEPGFVDARRCLSFWTIERRGAVPGEIAGRLGSWVFGCDDCQTACPWNRPKVATAEVDLVPRPGQRALAILDLLRMTEEEYRRRFNGTALARARYDGLVRNACLVAAQGCGSAELAALQALTESPFQGVREAARWALGRGHCPTSAGSRRIP